MDADDPLEYLRRLGLAGDGPHDIAMAALMLAALDRPGKPLEPYREHLGDIARAALAESHLQPGADDAARSLSRLLAGRFGYDGDRLTYEDASNADLIAVIERRRGLPVTLGILYMHAARAAGLAASGLNTPGHFLVELASRNSEVVIDPFNGGAALDREHIGAPPPMGGGDGAHLAEPVSDTDVLLRLENNLKLRALQVGERARGLQIAQRMVLIGPQRPELWLDLARLNEASGILGAARKAYESCLEIAKPGQGLHNEAALGLTCLKRLLN
jgi:regulator of sirC expression with transglutaminase-like and TPR domain